MSGTLACAYASRARFVEFFFQLSVLSTYTCHPNPTPYHAKGIKEGI